MQMYRETIPIFFHLFESNEYELYIKLGSMTSFQNQGSAANILKICLKLMHSMLNLVKLSIWQMWQN